MEGKKEEKEKRGWGKEKRKKEREERKRRRRKRKREKGRGRGWRREDKLLQQEVGGPHYTVSTTFRPAERQVSMDWHKERPQTDGTDQRA